MFLTTLFNFASLNNIIKLNINNLIPDPSSKKKKFENKLNLVK